jgi:hypothetical protein
LPERKIMKFRSIFPPALLATLLTLLAGCSHDFDENTVRSRAAGQMLQLDSEQVSLNSAQLGCGVQNELWEAPPPAESGLPAAYRLTQTGRDLQFSDDVYANEPGYPAPYAQVRGKFYLQVDNVVAINVASDGARLIQAAMSVKIPHPCFANPLPLMGIKKGKFAPDFAPTLMFENTEEGWYPTQLVH